MKKIIILLVLFHSIIFAMNDKKSWTIIVCSTANTHNAKAFINKNITNNKKELYIMKNGKRYRTAYGSYFTRNEAIQSHKNLPKNLQNIGAYIMKTKYDFSQLEKSKDVTVIPMHQVTEKKIKPMTTVTKNIEETSYQEEIEFTPMEPVIAPKKLFEKKQTKSVLTKRETKKVDHLSDTLTTKVLPKKPMKKIVSKEKIPQKTFPYKVKAKLKYSHLNQTGNFKIGQNGTKQKFIDLDIDTVPTITPAIEVAIQNHTVSASYSQSSVKENTTLINEMTLNDYTHPIDEKINSKLKTKWLRVGYSYAFPYFSLGADIHKYKQDFKISNEQNTASTNTTLNHIFPEITLNVKNQLDYNNQSYGLNYGVGYGKNSNIHFTEGYASFLVPLSLVDVSIGYELKRLKITNDTYDGKSTYQGINLELIKTF